MKPASLYEFGGSEAVQREVQSRFVKWFHGSNPVLDIGCGRGVFLDLIRAAGMEGIGVDHSTESLEYCKSLGLTVSHQDAISFLSDRPGEFGGILCSQVIEHMAYTDAMKLLDHCHRALRPDGTLVLATPNPEDLSVISETFWLDPTHVRPYPRMLLHSMLESNGFAIVASEHFLGSLRIIGRRRLPLYVFRRLLFGRYYGLPNTLVVARKEIAPTEAPVESFRG